MRDNSLYLPARQGAPENCTSPLGHCGSAILCSYTTPFIPESQSTLQSRTLPLHLLNRSNLIYKSLGEVISSHRCLYFGSTIPTEPLSEQQLQQATNMMPTSTAGVTGSSLLPFNGIALFLTTSAMSTRVLQVKNRKMLSVGGSYVSGCMNKVGKGATRVGGVVCNASQPGPPSGCVSDLHSQPTAQRGRQEPSGG